MSSINGAGIKIMECLYIMLESGCVITRLVYIGKQCTIEFTMNNSSWTIRAGGKIAETAVNKLCDQLKAFNVISHDDWQYHTTRFYCHQAAPPNANATANATANAAISTVRHTHNKNIAIMTFILNAILSGWRVKKSFSRSSEYRFNKPHGGKRKYLNADFLSRFLDHNIQT